jgi:hypothetical protein
MNLDLTELLDAWPYEPGKLNVRLVAGADGRPKVQIRLDLGIVQMECEGRPDGRTVNGYRSHLEFIEAQIDEHETSGEESLFTIPPDDCRTLRDEATQYYHRYLALMVLEDFDGVIRDTSRNLRLLDVVATYAETDDDRESVERFRPYLTMMRARAIAGQAVKAEEPKAALLAIDDALETLRSYFTEVGDEEEYEQSGEVMALRGIRESLVPKLPVSQKSELRRRIKNAVEQENYELAAILKKELSLLDD